MAADAGTAIFRAIADFSKLRKEAAKSRDELRRLKDEAEDTGVALELIDEEAGKADKGLSRFAKAAASARRDLDGLGDAAVDAGAGMELAAKAADELADELNDVTKSARRAKRELKGLGTEAVETAAKLEAAALASESLGDRMGGGFDRASERGSKLRAVLAELADVQRDLGRGADDVNADLGTLSQRFGQLDGAGDNLVRRYTEQGDGLRALSRAEQDAAAAQEVLLRSQERQDDAAGRVRVAEEKLAEARAKGKASASQIADLEEKLAASRRKHEASARATAQAEENVADAARRTTVEVEKVAQASERAADGHDKHGKAAGKARGELTKLEGDTERSGSKLLRFATIAGGVVTALGALGGGAGAAVGGVVALGGAVGSLSGLVGLLPGVLGAAGLGVATLKVGLSGFGDVLKAVGSGDMNAFNKAIADMGPKAQETARALMTWSPALQAIKRDTQEALVGGLGPALKAIGANYLPLVHDALQRTATAFNGVAKSTLDWLNQRGQIDTVRAILGNLATALEKAAPGAKNLASAFLTLFRVSSDQMPSLAEGFVNLTAKFDAFIQKAAADGSLKRWMDLGRKAAADLFVSLGNLGVVLGTVFTIGQEQGRGFFDVLRTVTGGMREFVTSAEGQSALRTFFANMHQAVVALMPAIQAAAKTIMQDLVPALASVTTKVGPGLADVFDGLGDAIDTARPGLDTFAGAVGRLLEALGNAGPLVGTVLSGALRGLAAIADVAAIAVNALSTAFNALPAPVKSIIENGVGVIVTFAGIVAGIGLLVGVLGTASAAVRVFAGGLAMIARGGKGSFLTGLSTMFGSTGKAARKAQKEVGGFGKSVTKTIDPLTREIVKDNAKSKAVDGVGASSAKGAKQVDGFTGSVAKSEPALNTATGAAKKTAAATGELGAAGAKAGREYPKTLTEGIRTGATGAATAAEQLATGAGTRGKAAAGKAGTEAGREYPRTLQQGLSPNSGGIASAMTAPIETGGRAATTAAGTHGGNAGRGFLSRLSGALRGGVGAITGALGSLMGGFGGASAKAGAAGTTAGGGFISRMSTRLRGGAAETTAAGTAATAGLGGASAAAAGAAGAKAGGGWVSRLRGVLGGAGGVLGIAAGVALSVMGSQTEQKAAEQGRLSAEGYIQDAKGHLDGGGQALASAGSSAWLLMFGQIGAVIAGGKWVYDMDRAAMDEYSRHKEEALGNVSKVFGDEGRKQVESASETGSGIVTAGSTNALMFQQAWKAGWDGTNKDTSEALSEGLRIAGEKTGGFKGVILRGLGAAVEATRGIAGGFRSAWDWISGIFGGGSENAVAAAGVPLVGLGGKIAGPVEEGGRQSGGVWESIKTAWSAYVTDLSGEVQTGLGAIGTFFSTAGTGIATGWNALWTGLGTAVSTAWTGITTAVSVGWTALQTVWNVATTALGAAWGLFWTGLTTVAQTAWTGLTTALQVGWTLLSTLWTTFTTALSLAWQLFWTGITTVAQTAWTLLQTGWQAFTTLITTLWTTLTTTLSTAWSTFWSTIQTVAQGAWSLLQTGLQALGTFFSTIFQTISDTTRTILQGAADAWNTIVDTVSRTIQSILQGIIDFLGGVFSTAWTGAQTVVQTVGEAISAAARGFASAISTAVDVAKAALGALVSAAQAAASAVGAALGLSGGGNVAPGPRGMAAGGPVEGMASGGATPLRRKSGPVHGSGREDKHHRLLMSDEFVVNRRDSKKHRAALELINSGRGDEVLPPGMAAGGMTNADGSPRTVEQIGAEADYWHARGGRPAELSADKAGTRFEDGTVRRSARPGEVEAFYKAFPYARPGSTPAKAGAGTSAPTTGAPSGVAPVTGAGTPVSTVGGAAAGGAVAGGAADLPTLLAALIAQLTALQAGVTSLTTTALNPTVGTVIGRVLPALATLQRVLSAAASRTSSTSTTVTAANQRQVASTLSSSQQITTSHLQADQTRTSSTQQSTSAISTASRQMASSTSSSASTIDSGANTVVAAAQRVAAATAALGGGGGGSASGLSASDEFARNAARPHPSNYRQAEDGSWVPPDYWSKRDRGGRMGAGGWYRNETGRPEYAFTEAQVLGKRRPPVDVSGMLGAVVPAGLSPLDGDYSPVSAQAADYGSGDGGRSVTLHQTNNIISPKAERGSAKLQAAGRQIGRRGVMALASKEG